MFLIQTSKKLFNYHTNNLLRSFSICLPQHPHVFANEAAHRVKVSRPQSSLRVFLMNLLGVKPQHNIRQSGAEFTWNHEWTVVCEPSSLVNASLSSYDLWLFERFRGVCLDFAGDKGYLISVGAWGRKHKIQISCLPSACWLSLSARQLQTVDSCLLQRSDLMQDHVLAHTQV